MAMQQHQGSPPGSQDDLILELTGGITERQEPPFVRTRDDDGLSADFVSDITRIHESIQIVAACIIWRTVLVPSLPGGTLLRKHHHAVLGFPT
jgi:hypothetical protein